MNYKLIILNSVIFFGSLSWVAAAKTPESTALNKKVAVIAHRAGRGRWSESSLDAMRWSVKNKFDGIEFDLNFSRDGTPFVYHDNHVRPFDGLKACYGPKELVLFEMSAEQIKSKITCHTYSYDFAGKRLEYKQKTVSKKSEQHLFTLGETLRVLRDSIQKTSDKNYKKNVRIYIEIKNGSEKKDESILKKNYSSKEKIEIVKNIFKTLKNYDLLDNAVIQSFNLGWLRICKQINPKVRRSMLVGASRQLRTPAELTAVFRKNLDSIEPHVLSPFGNVLRKYLIVKVNLLDVKSVAAAQNKGVSVAPWTINRADEWARLRKLGVDGIITDYPLTLRSWLIKN